MKCSVCGKEIDQAYHFCPWCGCDIGDSQPFKEMIDDSFKALEDVVRGDTMLRLENLSTRLSSIEQELDSFLLSSK